MLMSAILSANEICPIVLKPIGSHRDHGAKLGYANNEMTHTAAESKLLLLSIYAVATGQFGRLDNTKRTNADNVIAGVQNTIQTLTMINSYCECGTGQLHIVYKLIQEV